VALHNFYRTCHAGWKLPTSKEADVAELMPSCIIHKITGQHETANWFQPQPTGFVHTAYGLIHACPTVKIIS